MFKGTWQGQSHGELCFRNLLRFLPVALEGQVGVVNRLTGFEVLRIALQDQLGDAIYYAGLNYTFELIWRRGKVQQAA